MAGLGSIKEKLKEKNGTKKTEIFKEIELNHITKGPNIREKDDIEIDDLKHSIQSVGLLQPITVYEDKKDSYICLVGFRRFTAYKALNEEYPDDNKYKKIRCIITEKVKLKEKQIIENIQREDLTIYELYKVYNELQKVREEEKEKERQKGLKKGLKKVLSEKEKKQEKESNNKYFADLLGKTESYIKQQMTIVNIINKCPELKQSLKDGFAGETLFFSDIKEVGGINREKQYQFLMEKSRGELSRTELRIKVRNQKEIEKKEKAEKKQSEQEPKPKPEKQPFPKKEPIKEAELIQDVSVLVNDIEDTQEDKNILSCNRESKTITITLNNFDTYEMILHRLKMIEQESKLDFDIKGV